VANGYSLFPLDAKLGDHVGDWIVQIEMATFHELRDGDRANRLARRQPEHEGGGRHRHAGAGVAKSEVGESFAYAPNVDLRADMQAVSDSLLKSGGSQRKLASIMDRLRHDRLLHYSNVQDMQRLLVLRILKDDGKLKSGIFAGEFELIHLKP
jgi:hypothetical protein